MIHKYWSLQLRHHGRILPKNPSAVYSISKLCNLIEKTSNPILYCTSYLEHSQQSALYLKRGAETAVLVHMTSKSRLLNSNRYCGLAEVFHISGSFSQ